MSVECTTSVTDLLSPDYEGEEVEKSGSPKENVALNESFEGRQSRDGENDDNEEEDDNVDLEALRAAALSSMKRSDAKQNTNGIKSHSQYIHGYDPSKPPPSMILASHPKATGRPPTMLMAAQPHHLHVISEPPPLSSTVAVMNGAMLPPAVNLSPTVAANGTMIHPQAHFAPNYNPLHQQLANVPPPPTYGGRTIALSDDKTFQYFNDKIVPNPVASSLAVPIDHSSFPHFRRHNSYSPSKHQRPIHHQHQQRSFPRRPREEEQLLFREDHRNRGNRQSGAKSRSPPPRGLRRSSERHRSLSRTPSEYSDDSDLESVYEEYSEYVSTTDDEQTDTLEQVTNTKVENTSALVEESVVKTSDDNVIEKQVGIEDGSNGEEEEEEEEDILELDVDMSTNNMFDDSTTAISSKGVKSSSVDASVQESTKPSKGRKMKRVLKRRKIHRNQQGSTLKHNNRRMERERPRHDFNAKVNVSRRKRDDDTLPVNKADRTSRSRSPTSDHRNRVSASKSPFKGVQDGGAEEEERQFQERIAKMSTPDRELAIARRNKFINKQTVDLKKVSNTKIKLLKMKSCDVNTKSLLEEERVSKTAQKCGKGDTDASGGPMLVDARLKIGSKRVTETPLAQEEGEREEGMKDLRHQLMSRKNKNEVTSPPPPTDGVKKKKQKQTEVKPTCVQKKEKNILSPINVTSNSEMVKESDKRPPPFQKRVHVTLPRSLMKKVDVNSVKKNSVNSKRKNGGSIQANDDGKEAPIPKKSLLSKSILERLGAPVENKSTPTIIIKGDGRVSKTTGTSGSKAKKSSAAELVIDEKLLRKYAASLLDDDDLDFPTSSSSSEDDNQRKIAERKKANKKSSKKRVTTTNSKIKKKHKQKEQSVDASSDAISLKTSLLKMDQTRQELKELKRLEKEERSALKMAKRLKKMKKKEEKLRKKRKSTTSETSPVEGHNEVLSGVPQGSSGLGPPSRDPNVLDSEEEELISFFEEKVRS